MPEYLRALMVILVLASVTFAFARAPVCATGTSSSDFGRRRNLWLGVVVVAFLAHSVWLYAAVAGAMLLYTAQREQNKLAMYYTMLFVLPFLSFEIPGLGIVRFFFEMTYPRLLALTVLLPAFLYLRQQPDSAPIGQPLQDKLIIGYLVVICGLTFTASTATHTLRSGAFYGFIDIFLPYYVASRGLKNLAGFRDALLAFVASVMVLSALGAFEFARHWLLYSNLNSTLGVGSDTGFYLERGDGILRAQASAGHAIALGYVIAVAIGFYLYLKKSIPLAMARNLGFMLLLIGLIAPVSRGPWLGALLIGLLFIATGRAPLAGFVKLAMIAAILFPIAIVSPFGQKIINLLPFIGATEDHNVTYRQQLITITIGVISKNPLFGAYDYMYSPEMQSLKQGQGIIDVVNSYIGVALSTGLVGLFLFTGSFVTVVAGIFRSMRGLADKASEQHLLGQALFSTLLGIMVMIFTVSSISIIPAIYWSVIGLGVAYVRMLALARVPAKAGETATAARSPATPVSRRQQAGA